MRPVAPSDATVSASGPWTFSVDASSKATVRVREVLAQIRAPGDAVLTATGLKGTLTLNADGSFTPSSKITLDLSALRSDSNQRDGYVKDNVLEIRRFPTAELVPVKASGLAFPLPLSGDPAWKFGDFGMTISRVASVLSIEDDIRIEVGLVATETG